MTAMPAPRLAAPSGLWAIASFFNPLGYQTRLTNYRIFRRHLGVPLLTVEQGYDGRFELDGQDATILVQVPARDVMWQKERLLNLASARCRASVRSSCGWTPTSCSIGTIGRSGPSRPWTRR